MDLDPLFVAFFLAFLHLVGGEFSERIERLHCCLLSLGAGLMVGVFFIEILPQIAEGEEHLNHHIYTAFLLGFVFIHILEQSVYQNIGDKSEFPYYKATFEAGDLNDTGIDEAILESTTPDCMAYAQITPTVDVSTSDTLEVTWEITLWQSS